MNPKSYYQLDLLKGLSIIAVLVMHTFRSVDWRIVTYSPFHIEQAVPIFLVIMGITSTLSLVKSQKTKLSELYTKEYFLSRFERILIPVIVLTAFINVLGHFGIGYGSLNPGPGYYYIIILVQFIFFFPLIFKLSRHSMKRMLIVCFSINICFELVSPYVPLFLANPFIYNSSILRYLSAISLGVWISSVFNENGNFKDFILKNKLFLIGFFISISYLLAHILFGFYIPFLPSIERYINLVGFFYAAMLVVIGIKYFPKESKNRVVNFGSTLGKASYHIFLFQMFYFTIGYIFPQFPDTNAFFMGFYTTSVYFGAIEVLMLFLGFGLNFLICVFCGLAFYYIEKKSVVALFIAVFAVWMVYLLTMTTFTIFIP